MRLKYIIKELMLSKYKDKVIPFEERKALQIEVLKEVDAFCRANNIRYCLAYGTMLGAVRHKGYIPWDDDIDIHMPYPDMLRFKNEFKSDNYMYIDADNYSHFTFAFSRVVDKRTFTTGLFTYKRHDYGVCIDLYPVLGLPDSHQEVSEYIQNLIHWERKMERVHKFQNRFNGRMPFNIYPLDKYVNQGRQLFAQYPFEQATKWIGGSSSPCFEQVLEFNMFDELIEVEFENCHFLVPKEYDKYLTLRYGNYMQLPPENQRVPGHPRTCYWKQ